MSQGILLDEKMLSYDFGKEHVMSTNRILAAFYLLKEIFLENDDPKFQTILSRSLNREFLHKAHSHEYIQTLEKLSKLGTGEAPEYGLGSPDCPVWKGMAEVSEFVVESTITVTEEIYNDNLNFGFALLGGLHHASRKQASGFCYYNDINVAIHRLKALNPEIKILYLDTDLHHGDGVQLEFYDDPNVLTISLHESGQFLFPGTGFPREVGQNEGKGRSVNLPFYPYTWDKAYQMSFDALLPSLFESFNPDFVIWQAGSDAHIKDPLGHMMLTSNTYHHLGSKVRDIVIDVMDTPKVLALGGGGYNSYGNAKSWSNMLAGLADISLPAEGSDHWVSTCKEHNIYVQSALTETESGPIKSDKKTIEKGNRDYWDLLIEQIEPYYSI